MRIHKVNKLTENQERNRSEYVLSVVVPAYNEEEVLSEFHRRMADVATKIDGAVELVFVNDGSTDRTLEILQELRSSDTRISIVDLSRVSWLSLV